MSFDQKERHIGFHYIPPGKLSPTGRVVSVWENPQSGFPYKGMTSLSFKHSALIMAGKTEEAAAINQIMQKMKEEKARREGPRFL